MDDAIRKLATLFDGYGIALFTLVVVAISAILSGAIGFERERHGYSAGFRTHMLVGIGSCLFMIISKYAFTDLSSSGDPGRIAAQVVTGIGFLGAGAILQTGFSVKGLTTAATLWVVAAIGMCTGAGLVLEAIIVCVAALLVLVILKFFEIKLSRGKTRISYLVPFDQKTLSEAIKVIDELGFKIKDIDVHKERSGKDKYNRIILTIGVKTKEDILKIIATLEERIGPDSINEIY